MMTRQQFYVETMSECVNQESRRDGFASAQTDD